MGESADSKVTSGAQRLLERPCLLAPEPISWTWLRRACCRWCAADCRRHTVVVEPFMAAWLSVGWIPWRSPCRSPPPPTMQRWTQTSAALVSSVFRVGPCALVHALKSKLSKVRFVAVCCSQSQAHSCRTSATSHPHPVIAPTTDVAHQPSNETGSPKRPRLF